MMGLSLQVLLFFTILVNLHAKTPLPIGALVPYIYKIDRFCFQSAIKVATKLVNEDPNILPDYEIVMQIEETAVSLLPKFNCLFFLQTMLITDT